MGGKPITALNLVMFPTKNLDTGLLKEILRGGNDKVIEAGASLAGGHSVDDNEPKYGLAVTGIVNPDKILTNSGAKEGDALVLTKPLGSGVLFNASRSKKLPYSELEAILPQIASLNKTTIDIALNFDIHACTDVTGFGIVGHTIEIAKGSGSQINLSYKDIPYYPNTLEMYMKGETTGSNKANKKLSEGLLQINRRLSEAEQELLFDPQTSGGLLLSLPEFQARDLINQLKQQGIDHAVKIGVVIASGTPLVQVI
jgi:selenide,water dikinase